MDSYKKLVGDRIRSRRLELGFESQDMLADELHKAGARNVDQSRISRWESGESLPSRAFRRALLRALDTTEDRLFGAIQSGPEPAQPAASLQPAPPEPFSAAWQEAADLLVALAGASPMRHLTALYVLTSRQEYLDAIRKLPNSAPTVQFLESNFRPG